jgi:large subunit ribosomal protein L11
MAKNIQKQIKVQAIGGKATPAPPLGPVLGQAGINIGEFVNQFNSATQDRMGEVVPTVITVYDDRSFSLEYKEAPMSAMVLKELGIKSGSGENTKKKVGTLNQDQVRKIAEAKMPDLNAGSVEAAMKIVEGTCRSMGVDVK